MGEFSIWHMAILFLIVLIIFGPKNLPKVGQALGKGIREFKDAAKGITSSLEEDERNAQARRESEAQPPQATPPPPPVQPPVDQAHQTGTSNSETRNQG